jgi:hypothetical protein
MTPNEQKHKNTPATPMTEARLLKDLRKLVYDDDDDEAEPPAPASLNPTTTTATTTARKATSSEEADVSAIVARAVAQTQGRSSSGVGASLSASSSVPTTASSADWVRTPDGELVQTRGARSVSLASQEELSDIMASVASAKTLDEVSKSGARSTFASRALNGGDDVSGRNKKTSLRPEVAANGASPSVINVDFATLTGTAWNDVLASLDEQRDLTTPSPLPTPPASDGRRSSDVVYSKLPNMAEVALSSSVRSASDRLPVSSKKPTAAAPPAVTAPPTTKPTMTTTTTTTASASRSSSSSSSPRSAGSAVSPRSALMHSASPSPRSTDGGKATLAGDKICTRCQAAKVAARIKLQSGKLLALCRSCTLAFKEASMQPRAMPVRVLPFDPRYVVPSAWAGVRERLTATLRDAKERGDDDALAKLKIPSQDALLWSPRAPTPGVRSATLVITLPDRLTVSVRASADFSFMDLLRVCADHCGVWQVELFGLCRRLADLSEVWLSSEPYAPIGERADSGIDWLAQQALFFRVKYWKTPKFLIDNRAAHLMAAQAAECVATGAWPCSLATAVELAAMRVRIELGAYDARRHSMAMLTPRLAQWLPAALMARCGSASSTTLGEWLFDVYTRVDATHLPKSALGESEELLLQRFVRLYIKCVRKLPTFGVTQFECTRTDEAKESAVRLGVAEDGVLLSLVAAPHIATHFAWTNVHEWRQVGDDRLEFEVEARDPAVLRGDAVQTIALKFASVGATGRCLALVDGYWSLVGENPDLAGDDSRATPRRLRQRQGDVLPELYFPPSARARFDGGSSRLELLQDAYVRATVALGVMPADAVLELIEQHLRRGEQLTRVELNGGDALGLDALVDGIKDALRYAVFDGTEALGDNLQLRELVLRHVPLAAGAAVRSLGVLMHACRASLRALSIEHCALGGEGARTLCQYVVDHGQLVHLSLRGNGIGSGDGVELARVLAGRKTLVSLTLDDNGFGEKAARAAASMLAARDNWLRVELAENDFGDAGCVAIVRHGIELGGGSPRLDTIDLSRTGMSTKGAAALLKLALKQPVLRRMRLGRNDLHSEKLVDLWAPLLAPAAAAPPLATLDVRHASLPAKALAALVGELSSSNANTRLEELVLSGNAFEARLAAQLPIVLGGLPSLVTLGLARCALPSLVLASLFVALSGSRPLCAKLAHLDVGEGDLRGDAVEPALRSLIVDRTSLQSLDISSCRLVATGVKSLCDGLSENSTLVSLLIDGVGLGPNALTTMARALRSHRALEKVSFRSSALSTEGMSRFIEKLASAAPPKLVSVDISGNTGVDVGALRDLARSSACRFQLINNNNNSGGGVAATTAGIEESGLEASSSARTLKKQK